MKFIHAVVFRKDDFENSNYNTSDWEDLTDRDFVVHALYDCENQEIVMVDDNYHSKIETKINAFFMGIERCGHSVQEIYAYLILKDGCYDEYDEEVLVAHMKEDLYVEVEAK